MDKKGSSEMSFIGIDLGGTCLKIGIRDSGCEQLHTFSVSQSLNGLGPEEVFGHIFCEIGKLNGTLKHGAVIGLSMPGEFDARRQRLNCRRFGLREFSYVEPFKTRGWDVVASNDGQASGLGECKFGAGKRFRDFIVVNLGTGTGGAVVLNGELLRSSQGRPVGVFAHMSTDPNGKVCRCGRRGCWETICDRQSILNRARRAGLDCADVKDIALLAQTDERAKEVFADLARSLASGMANLADMFNPEAIVLGGGISLARHLILEPLKEALLPLIREGRDIHIECSELGQAAGVLGATFLAETAKCVS